VEFNDGRAAAVAYGRLIAAAAARVTPADLHTIYYARNIAGIGAHNTWTDNTAYLYYAPPPRRTRARASDRRYLTTRF